MGLRINLQHASWLAHILKPAGPVPVLVSENELEQRVVLRQFADQLRNSFFSGMGHERVWHDQVSRLADAIGEANHDPQRVTRYIEEIRHFLGDRPWTALVLPSTGGTDFDRELCDESLLRRVVEIRPEDPGLILQLQEPPRDTLVLKDLFPAFRTALASISEWPGVLLWQNSGDARFFPIDGSVPVTVKR